jgi:hypothetical protein
MILAKMSVNLDSLAAVLIRPNDNAHLIRRDRRHNDIDPAAFPEHFQLTMCPQPLSLTKFVGNGSVFTCVDLGRLQ